LVQEIFSNRTSMMALVMLLRTQRCYLIGQRFTVKTDHISLKHFQTQPSLPSRQVRWVQTLQEVDVKIEFLPGKFNTIAAPTMRLNVAPAANQPSKFRQ
jgi:hypothetical protein